MTLSATEFEPPSGQLSRTGSVVEQAHWGYVIRDRDAWGSARALVAASGRFVGTLMLMVAGGLLLLPDSAHAAELAGMKLAATVVFTTLGLIFYYAGSAERHPEVHVDTLRAEIRVGRRGARGGFRRTVTLTFDDIVSVYLLRSKDRTRPTRLFLRLAGGDIAIEAASGSEGQMEALREALARDLAHDPRRPVEPGLQRPSPRTA